MGIKVRELNEAFIPAWDRFVFQCPQAGFFHRAGWSRVIRAAYGQLPLYLYAERDGAMVGILPLVLVKSPIFGCRLVSTAFTVGGGVAAVDEQAAQALDQAAIDLMRRTGAQCLELRQPSSLHHGGGWVTQSDIHATFSRPIAEDEDECLKQIPRKQRAVVRKALEGELIDEIEGYSDHFFPLYAYSMRNMGTPVFGARFFRLLMAEFSKESQCLTVRYRGIPIASVLSFYFRDNVMPYYTGCRPQARDLGANDFMYWRLMRRSQEAGYGVFDFGRSKVGSGPYAFKKNWGFQPEPVFHEYFLAEGAAPPEINQRNPKYSTLVDLWKHLPLAVANMLGPMVVRQIG